MVDILIFVYENFFASGIYPTHSVLQNRLFAAGFSEDEVEETLAWLENISPLTPADLDSDISHAVSQRCLEPTEFERIGAAGWGFIAFLENNQILSATQRELILSGIMALDEPEVDLDRLKLIVLMVLWRQGYSLEALLVEELIHYQDWILQ
ncbi:MAG: DUF494 domain-containing protein [Betaproteobacteria bacterium]|nr:DUF494 domain-containing protein [Betaproteobacteria bacterium]